MTTRILLIDPDINFMVSIKQALEGTREFLVTVSANGTAAAEALRIEKYGAAIVDFGLPDMDIMELIVKLRQVEGHIPVIATPASPLEHERLRFMDIQGSISKPYTARELIPYLRSVINRSAGTTRKTAADEFVPPQMPAMLQDLIRPDDSPEGPSPTALLDAVEREKLSQSPPLDLVSANEILAEFETLERHQTGDLFLPHEADSLLEAEEEDDGKPDTATLLQWAESEMEPEEPDSGPESPAATRYLEPEPEALDTTALLDWGDSDDTASLSGTRVLSEEEELPDTASLLEWAEPGDTDKLIDTGSLRSSETPPPSTTLEWQTPPDAGRAARDEDFDALAEEHGWDLEYQVETKPLGPREDEPPRRFDDTPPVPPQDLPGVRQFLATDAGEQDPSDFGEVLDVMAQSPPGTERPSRRDPFDDLVASMREPEQSQPPRSRLEDLLYSIAQDAHLPSPETDNDTALDYVLDAIRRTGVAEEQDQEPVPELEPQVEEDDTTIGEILDGLLDPAFEGVLAALAGEEIDDDSYEEPTYTYRDDVAESIEAQREDLISFEEMSADEDSPAWLADFEAESLEPSRPRPPVARFGLDEPGISEDDSSSYPATAALEAVSGDEEESEFSLNRLLSQIAEQLPPELTARPRLTPLPSWQKDDVLENDPKLAAAFGLTNEIDIPDQGTPSDAQQMLAMFDHMEGVSPDEAQAELATELGEDLPPEFARDGLEAAAHDDLAAAFAQVLGEPAPAVDDTRPVAMTPPLLEEIDLREADTRPVSVIDPDMADSAEGLPIEALPAVEEEADWLAQAAEAYFQEDSGFDREPRMPYEDAIAEDELTVDLPAGFDDLTDLTEILADDELVEEALRGRDDWTAPDLDEIRSPTPVEPPDTDYEPAEDDYSDLTDILAADEIVPEVPVERDDWAAPDHYRAPYAPAEDLYDGYEQVDDDISDLVPDDDHLIPVPADEAGRFFEDRLRLDMPEADAVQHLAEEQELARTAVLLTQYSLESSAQATMLSRPGQLMAQAGELPAQAMTRIFKLVDTAWQTRSAGDSNALIRFVKLPEVGEFLLYSILVENDMALSMVFHASTPVRTIRRQARRLSESLAVVPEGPEIPDELETAATLPSRPTGIHPPAGLADAVSQIPGMAGDVLDAGEPYAGYTCLWLPHDPGQELLGDYAEGLYTWIEEIAAGSAWNLETIEIRPDYVVVAMQVPRKSSPDAVIAHLMQTTAERTVDQYPEMDTNGAPLWANGYYVVAPTRELSEREIARFITYQRQAQLG